MTEPSRKVTSIAYEMEQIGVKLIASIPQYTQEDWVRFKSKQEKMLHQVAFKKMMYNLDQIEQLIPLAISVKHTK